MGDVLLGFIRNTLPDDLVSVLGDFLDRLETGEYDAIFQSPQVALLLGFQNDERTKEVYFKDFPLWTDYIFCRLGLLLANRSEDSNTETQNSAACLQHLFLLVAVACIYAFLQSNVTGPPLPFSSAKLLFPQELSSNQSAVSKARRDLILSLSTDGEAAYKLTPNIELLCLADTILSKPPIQKTIRAAAWAKLRVNFLHQRLLSELAPSLQSSIYETLETLEPELLSSESPLSTPEIRVQFLLERASIHTHHGFDKKARSDLDQAAVQRHFEFALTGLLGRRTKFQTYDTSQLLVLARSAGATNGASQVEEPKAGTDDSDKSATVDTSKPKNLDLNDDTLLEQISFVETPSSTDIKDESKLTPSLTALDPANQPLLEPLDSIILLSLASSITNTSPSDGLTREETIPYATRVLDGGSSNWQIYTQALLVRSRIEGYRSRTIERGLLQLQALVDQVIADTTAGGQELNGTTTFLPKLKETESAPVSERLKYIFQLCTPSRWELEAELASRWVSMGGLRSALEIYERLEMWAEVALCWAATEREDKAKKIIRRQLFHATASSDEKADLDEENWEGPARDPAPADAPRLYCILGDIDKDIAMYETAWTVSNNRYARAQRSLGRHYFSLKNYERAITAYAASLKINALNHASWFALGCAHLELSQFKNAVESFSRCVQLDDSDAEAWSNLAAALLHLRTTPPESSAESSSDLHPYTTHTTDPQQPRLDALKAFRRAAVLKHDSHRIWANLLTIAASTIPPSYNDIVRAQTRICELRGSIDGEACVDEAILAALVRHIALVADGPYDPAKPGLARMVVEMVEQHVVPLITASAALWKIVARMALFRGRPSEALGAHEKAWRVVVGQPGWETGSEKQWDGVVDATVELADAYESLGEMERTEGLGAGSGEVVAKDWRFKARSVMRGIMGRGKESWEGTEGWERLVGALEGLKGGR
jgi:tetratricopeptide (TPR) repeat protein